VLGAVRYEPGNKIPTGIHMSAIMDGKPVFSLFIENKNELSTSCTVEDSGDNGGN
jgi:hypothetical protein